ncbi:hypothetical protein RMSM_00160 [Rhodopirellula maiorica SM1]|uniref:Uncharacterized protein n=1 Tax=Rhodopirellula maiorica SM1 TaxID=1265738 RepID=M5RUP3_9BACT|nr:hypothetical protein RMSM_00160 [Rhodopirellula maiorica SM1]
MERWQRNCETKNHDNNNVFATYTSSTQVDGIALTIKSVKIRERRDSDPMIHVPLTQVHPSAASELFLVIELS